MIKIKSITPSTAKGTVFERKTCYLGVSLDNKYMDDAHLPELLQWIDSHFDRCLIIIGDYLNRHNMYDNALSDDAIGAQAIEMGDALVERIRNHLGSFQGCDFQIVQWRDFTDSNADFASVLNFYQTAYHANAAFAAAIDRSAQLYVDGKIRKGALPIASQDAFNRSLQYLLEEIAVFDLLARQGYTVKIYPGTILAVLKDFADGLIPEVSPALADTIYVEIKT